MPDWTVGPGGQLSWGGSGPAPFLTPELQQQVRRAGGGATPAGALYGMYSPSPGASPIPIPGYSPPGVSPQPVRPPARPSGPNPGLVPYTPGPITSVVNDLLHAALSGGTGPGGTLNQLSTGQIPPAIEKQFQQNIADQNAAITEKMGAVGNRFGTDLSRTLADAAGRANVNLAGDAMTRALGAINSIINLGSGQQTLEFGGQQAALDRAHQDFLASQQGDSFASLLPFLLQLTG
jgi:hypothetical protein